MVIMMRVTIIELLQRKRERERKRKRERKREKKRENQNRHLLVLGLCSLKHKNITTKDNGTIKIIINIR